MVPIVVCHGRHVVFLRGAVYDVGEGPLFPGLPSRGAHYVFAGPERAQAHSLRRAYFRQRGLGPRSRRRRPCWKFCQVLTEPYHKTTPSEYWHQKLAEASPFDPVWDIGFRADEPEARNPHLWPGEKSSEKLVLPSATPFAQAKPGWQTPPLSAILHSDLARWNLRYFPSAASP